ncbi:MAG: hypothetical protein P4L85_09235 [Paludisphaera borealis]|uniref:hypothetical protein n=1 Tax=Paludisphaera borealis TaxID=1387353 RepID=UPI002851EA2A|nr:hypothetical protein [Paludisphaera borealis]MDR3619520.1 hypothetical protein [Paludisphaera borealis]
MTFRWIRFGPPALVGLLILAQASPLAAQTEKVAGKPMERPKFKELVVSPAPAPIPAFRYSLLPSSARLKPGDAAPIYLRLRYDVPDEEWDKAQEKSGAWLDCPIQDLPLKEVESTLARLEKRFDLLTIAAHRATCDWNYPLDEQRTRAIDLQLNDVNTLRGWGRLLALKARVEIAGGRFEDAARTIETGLAFGKHVGKGPFLINALVGVAIENTILSCLDDWIAQPGAPNLYWALTALPRPLLGLREAVEQERLFAENMIPELADVDAPRSPAAWSLHLESMYNRMQTLARRLFPNDPNTAKPKDVERLADELTASLGADLAAYKQANLATFRKQLVESGIFSEDQARAMSDDEAMSRGVVLGYQTLWDEVFKLFYLSYGEAEKAQMVHEKLTAAAKDGPFALFAMLQPSLYSTQSSDARLGRRVALLRTVEAIRLYAASHEGKLPDSLDAVHEAPIPTDPVTGRAFSLKVDGDVATLIPPNAPLMFSPDYKITIRKGDPKASSPR